MPTTIAKVIAFELGLLIAILTWMQFSKPTESRTENAAVEQQQESNDETLGAVSPVYRPSKPRSVVDYRAEDQFAPVEETRAVVPRAVVYAQDPVAEPHPDYGYGYGDSYGAAPDPDNYIGYYPEPVLSDPYWDNGFYGPAVYQQPAHIIIISSNTCTSQRRHQTQPRNSGRRPTMSHPRPRQVQPQPRSAPRVIPRRGSSPGSSITTSGPRVRPPAQSAGRRVSTTGSHQARHWNRKAGSGPQPF